MPAGETGPVFSCPSCGTPFRVARRMRNHLVVCPVELRLKALYEQAKAEGLPPMQALVEAEVRYRQETEVAT